MITNPPALIQQFLDGEIKFINRRIKKNNRTLEVGCGYGRLLKILAKRANNVTGIDFSKKMIAEAKKNLKGEDNIKVYEMDATKLEFGNKAFDCVVCLDNSLGNMPKTEGNAVKEMARVCKAGGQIVVSVFSENAKKSQLERYKRRRTSSPHKRRILLKKVHQNGIEKAVQGCGIVL